MPPPGSPLTQEERDQWFPAPGLEDKDEYEWLDEVGLARPLEIENEIDLDNQLQLASEMVDELDARLAEGSAVDVVGALDTCERLLAYVAQLRNLAARYDDKAEIRRRCDETSAAVTAVEQKVKGLQPEA